MKNSSRAPIEADLASAFRGPVDASSREGAERSLARVDGDLPSYVFMKARVDPPSAPLRAPRSEKSPSSRIAIEPDMPAIGSIVDKYRIEELLGRGGFAAVYRATHLLLSTPVALKLLRPRIIKKDPSFAKILCEEARYAARISHPNVVRVQDVTHTPAITYVVMELIDGPTLAQVIERDGVLAPKRVVEIAIDIVAGLRAGYEQGLIHRDIKPANVLIAKNGVPKIVDLGLAYPMVNTDSASEAAMSMPRTGPVASRLPVVGTPAYMAPEQSVNPEAVDFRSDVYSLGVTMFHCLTGQIPFHAQDASRCIEMHRTQPVPRPEARQPGIPTALADLVVDMMAKSPDARPASYAQLTERLQTILKTVADKPCD